MVAISTSFFFLITFNEQYLFSTVIFAPCLILYMRKTGMDGFNTQGYEISLKSVYIVFIYLVIAYQTEMRTK